MKAPRVWFSKPNYGSSAKVITIILFVIFVVLASGLWLNKHRKKTSPLPSQPLTARQVETMYKQTNNNYLKLKDYSSFQVTQQTLAQQYLASSDPQNAERVMLNVFKVVPVSNLDTGSYLTIINVEEAKKDTVQEKHYLQLFISKLNKDGDTAQAARYQGILNKL